MNVQLHYHSDEAELPSMLIILNPQYICPSCAKESFKYYFVLYELPIFIKHKMSHQFAHLEQTTPKESADTKGFVITLLFYSLIYIS